MFLCDVGDIEDWPLPLSARCERWELSWSAAPWGRKLQRDFCCIGMGLHSQTWSGVQGQSSCHTAGVGLVQEGSRPADAGHPKAALEGQKALNKESGSEPPDA